LLAPKDVDSRNTSRPGSVDDTRRVPVVDFAPTRIYRQARQVRTPVRSAPAVIAPEVRGSQLAHPRLVRRTRPLRVPSHRERDFDDEPTGRRI
jgi:hypothetical protein